LFSAVISEHFSENRIIISLVAAKLRYPKKCAFFWGHPVYPLYDASKGNDVWFSQRDGFLLLLLLRKPVRWEKQTSIYL